MKDCIGFWGKLFGHNFEGYIIKYSVPAYHRPFPNTSNESSWCDIAKSLADKEYRVICKRCGIRR
jgi:hypothetical protein